MSACCGFNLCKFVIAGAYVKPYALCTYRQDFAVDSTRGENNFHCRRHAIISMLTLFEKGASLWLPQTRLYSSICLLGQIASVVNLPTPNF